MTKLWNVKCEKSWRLNIMIASKWNLTLQNKTWFKSNKFRRFNTSNRWKRLAFKLVTGKMNLLN